MAASTLNSSAEFAKDNSLKSADIGAVALTAHSLSAFRDILARRALLSLSRLNDHTLADLGVERGAIVSQELHDERASGEAVR